jgi:hypothetical protein
MAATSKHSVAATVVIPTVTVPAYELVPGYYSVGLPGSTQTINFTSGLAGTTPGATTAPLRRAVHPRSGVTCLVMNTTSPTGSIGEYAQAGPATARAPFSFVKGRSYKITWKWGYHLDGVLPDRYNSGWNTAVQSYTSTFTGNSYWTHTVELTPEQLADTGRPPSGVYIESVTIETVGTSFYTPPVMQPARTIPGSTVALSVKSASVTLDDSWSPYAQAALVCYAPSIEVLEALDPRKNLRVSITPTPA